MLKLIYRYKLTLIIAAVVVTLSLISTSDVPSTKLWDFKGIDKLVHLCMYSALSLVLYMEKDRDRNKNSFSRHPFSQKNIYQFLILISVGGIIELIQPVLANRSREIFDFVANTGGVIIGFYVHIWLKQSLKC